jgi:hypothetical protein
MKDITVDPRLKTVETLDLLPKRQLLVDSMDRSPSKNVISPL